MKKFFIGLTFGSILSMLSQTLLISTAAETSKEEVALLVNSQTYSQLKDELNQYKSDVESYFPVNITISQNDKKTPQEIRSDIKTFYDQKKISGVILVGAMPMHRFYMHEFANPNPMYYEAFDTTFKDTNGDGFDDTYVWKADMMKIWVANFRASSNPNDSAVEELRTFFKKTHDYYSGNQILEKRFLSVGGGEYGDGAINFANKYANKMFGNTGDTLVSPNDTKANLTELFTKHKYMVFRIQEHSGPSVAGLYNGDINSDEIYKLPNKALITFNLGCSNGNWLENRSNQRNNGISWAFSNGNGQACVSGVRVGTLYREETLYDKLIAGEYLGKAYLACKTASENDFHKETPNGTIVSGNLLFGNPFLKVVGFEPTQKPTPSNSVTPIPTPTALYKKGDVNGDGVVNSTDFALMRRYILSMITAFPSVDGEKAADMNGDANINSLDFALLKRVLMGIS